MLLEDVLRNPLLKRALTAGEERVGKVIGRLLSSERLASGLSSLVSSAAQARQTLDRGVQEALHAANLPSKEDVAALKRRLDELEAMLDGLSARVEPRVAPRPGADPGAPAAGGGERGDVG